MVCKYKKTIQITKFALGTIRLTTGTIGLLMPKLLIKRIYAEGDSNVAASYAFRLFGIRTILLGLELFSKRENYLARSIKLAPLIHGSDVISASIAAKVGKLPRNSQIGLVGISTLNTLLSLVLYISAKYSRTNKRRQK